MKTTYKKIANIQDLMKKVTSSEVVVSDAIKIKDAALEMEKAYDNVQAKVMELFEKHGHQKENGSWQVNEGSEDEFKKEYNDFLNEEVDLENFPVTISDSNSLKITARDLVVLEEFFNFS